MQISQFPVLYNLVAGEFPVKLSLSSQYHMRQLSWQILVQSINRNTRKSYQLLSKLTLKTSERRQCLRSGVLIVNLEHFSLILVILLVTLNRQMFAGKIVYDDDDYDDVMQSCFLQNNTRVFPASRKVIPKFF